MNRQSLLNLIAPLAPAVSRITGGHILLNAQGATAVSEQISLTMRGELPIECCPDYATLKGALSGLTGESINFAQAADTLTLTSRGRRVVRCLPVSSFPALPEDVGEAVTVDGAELAEAIDFVVRAAIDDLSKPHLAGVHFNGNDVVATDTHRLRVYRVSAKLPRCTIPIASASALARVLSGSVSVSLGNRLTVESEAFSFSTTLAAAGFPEAYPKVIPSEEGRKLVVASDDMVRAVNAVSAFADSKTKRVFLSIDEDCVNLSCDNADEPLNVGAWDGGAHKVLVNGALLADTLSAFGKTEVTITFKDGVTSPIRFDDGTGKVAVLMPMRHE